MEGTSLSAPSPAKLHPFSPSPYHQGHTTDLLEDIKQALHASSILSFEESSYSQSPLAEQAVPFNLLGNYCRVQSSTAEQAVPFNLLGNCCNLVERAQLETRLSRSTRLLGNCSTRLERAQQQSRLSCLLKTLATIEVRVVSGST
jgi:hypothetical protein